MPPEVAKVRELLSAMPVEDQLALFLIAIVEANPSALSISLRMLSATVKLSQLWVPRTGSEFQRLCAITLILAYRQRLATP
jgi:hypothetical protein